MTKFRALAALIVLTLLPIAATAEWWDASPPPLSRRGNPMPASWWAACKEGSRQHGSNPFLVASVADIESNGWQEGRLGRSRYVGPMGFNLACNIPDWVIYNPKEQIKWACRLLAGGPQRLKKYNTTWYKDNYLRDVTNLASKMEWEAKQIAYGW